jgi:hypothetical protein
MRAGLTLAGLFALFSGVWVALTGLAIAAVFLYCLAFLCMAAIANITSTKKDTNS